MLIGNSCSKRFRDQPAAIEQETGDGLIGLKRVRRNFGLIRKRINIHINRFVMQVFVEGARKW